MTRPRVADGGDGLQIWRVAENILNKQSRISDKGWTSSLGGYWLLLRGGIVQSVPRTTAIFIYYMSPSEIVITPDSYISALWMQQRHLVAKRGVDDKCP
jgi:hypothetical protein